MLLFEPVEVVDLIPQVALVQTGLLVDLLELVTSTLLVLVQISEAQLI